MNYGLEIQTKSKDSLQNSLKVIEETKRIGQETIQRMELNTEQIISIHDKVETIETTLSRSIKVVKRIGRKMITDKYIWGIFVLLLGTVIFIIVWEERRTKN